MSIMSFRLFLISVLLATAFAQSTTARRGRGGRWRSRFRTRTRSLRPTGGFFPTGGSGTGTGGLFPTSVVAPVDPVTDVPGGSTVIVTTVVTTDVTATTDVTVTGDAPTAYPTAEPTVEPTSEEPVPEPTTALPTSAIPTTRPPPATTAAPAPPSSTYAPTPSSSAPAPSAPTGSTKKKGLSFTNPSQLTPWTGKNVGWTYNWWTTRGDVPTEMEYFPMMWCPTKLSVSAWTTDANKAISQGSKRLLGFNEPDQKGQCDITYTAAATGHQAYMNPFKGKALIGSPAVTNGGGSMGLAYQENFLKACAGNCTVDFLNMHWYGNKQNAVYNFQLQVNKTIALGEKYGIDEVWVTEFGLNDGTDQEKADFVTSVGDWMDTQGKVGGYSYFMTSDGILNKGSAISPVLGAAYAEL
ncbi:glycosyl hydrolase catalytic core-domain-containing protein [Elsinoe ampelina]|uniref:Glycosyl hydrolase catalytic core-domain-containing protein n=1 Tax=Elsinoe ampelina TaxID=302913 RepID=A0A6A6G4L7_9PEZI|nr:glycosyl hydrolase catalytic core-domain-containing protein [Elsinoe ampelina]